MCSFGEQHDFCISNYTLFSDMEVFKYMFKTNWLLQGFIPLPYIVYSFHHICVPARNVQQSWNWAKKDVQWYTKSFIPFLLSPPFETRVLYNRKVQAGPGKDGDFESSGQQQWSVRMVPKKTASPKYCSWWTVWEIFWPIYQNRRKPAAGRLIQAHFQSHNNRH